MSYRVTWLEGQSDFCAHAGEPLLLAAERAGVALPHDCRLGGCGSCRVQLVKGAVDYAQMPFALTPDEHQAGQVLACQAFALSDLVISLPQAAATPNPPTRMRAQLQSLRALAPDVMRLRLTLPPAGALHYAPGQYLNIVLADGRKRSFSMASAPLRDTVDLHVRQWPGGRFTDTALRDLRPGDELDLELPLGGFHFHFQDDRPVLMLATGTGLAPLKAMLEALMGRPDCPPVTLYWGGRSLSDLYLHDEIAAWGERLFEFAYRPVLSRADASWTGRRGHVQQAVLADLGDITQLADLAEHALYLCGSPAMVRDATRELLAHGASREHLYTDSFLFQPDPEADRQPQLLTQLLTPQPTPV